MKVWCDVEDLFQYASAASRLSGIQRLSCELYAALHAAAPTQIGFVRHDRSASAARVVDWIEIEALHASLTQAPSAAAEPAPHGVLRTMAEQLPMALRRPLGRAARVLGLLAPRPHEKVIPPASASVVPATDLREFARPGDVLATLGAAWAHPDYDAFVARVTQPAGLRFAMLVYDLIPLVRPEFHCNAMASTFRDFMRRCLPRADTLLAISQATARDILLCAAREGMALRTAPGVIPIGTGFARPASPAPLPAGLAPGDYVLFVSTIEVRKNHLLAFRAWRRLLDEMPAAQVPRLVFAGRIGWMVADLLEQIRNTDHLGGKLVLVDGPDDATLASLYQGARFTVFPSLYEGWGLPVSESLAFGKVCIASASTSIQEAGGMFCLYHDPDSVTDALALYRRAITEPALIASLEARIAAAYRPTPWSRSAEAVLAALRS